MLARIAVICIMLLPSVLPGQETLWRCEGGVIAFTSDAPLELIEAASGELQGVINPETGQFAFAVAINTFVGFNSPLQQEHFNENYLESDRFPRATFSGRIIEEVNLREAGNYTIRAKGDLVIHGVEHERIIKSQVTVEEGNLRVQASFTVPLADHDIRIPRIVYQKIAEEILVEVNASFRLMPSNS